MVIIFIGFLTGGISKNASNEVTQEGLTQCSVLEALSNVADLMKYRTTAGEGHSLVQGLVLLQNICLL